MMLQQLLLFASLAKQGKFTFFIQSGKIKFAKFSLLCMVGHYPSPPGSTTSVLLANSLLIGTTNQVQTFFL